MTFYIYNTNEPKNVKGSLVFGNIIFDIGSSGELLGMQIEEASPFFNTSPEMLKKIKEAKLKVSTGKNFINIVYNIFADGIKSNNSFMFPRDKIQICN